ncbi:glycoside hydrolase [Mucilaginibacter pallidiroseus]|uniref:Glycoside hydrolase n=1 Tax=Mucilaginibacter pallidiroseus TaxID=2599295 RepID=A0A563UIG5_9SPHI|nr:glycoside hydrolase family 76 protein [Mucilaginibacter pallidiroseus]TWR31162.1 glycoside hydrolase [Mucilaginibacter pallidiroseus]
MKKLHLIVIIVCASVFSTLAQTMDYAAATRQLHSNIYSRFFDKKQNLFLETTDSAENRENHSFLWPLCGLIQAANEMEVVNPNKSYISPVMVAIQQYYTTRPPAPAYQAMVVREKQDNRFYDDNQWIAIALMDAYDRTHRKEYLNISKTIYRFLLTGLNDVGGGGFYWEEGNFKSKNTCSNGPGILVGLRLYQATKQKAYLDTAVKVYNWTKSRLLAPNGVYFDNIRLPSQKIDSAYYTYNAGTMLQSGVLLYNITKNKKYLDDAVSVANAAEKQFYRNGKLRGDYWFNAVLLRGYLELYKVDKNKQRLQFFVADANRIWKDERDSKGLVGTKNVKRLIDQAAMLEIYARLQKFEGK